MEKKKVLYLTALIMLFSVPTIASATENNLLSGITLNYSKISSVLGNIEVNSKSTGKLIQLPNGNFVKSVNNTNDKYNPYKVNYQVSKPKDYSFIIKSNDDKNDFVESVKANDLTLNAIVTGSNKLNLQLSSEDTTSSVTEMRFSDDGKTWCDFVPFSKTYEWTIADKDGIHTVYVQFKDKAGNLSTPTSTVVYLDKTAPKLSFDINKGSSITNSKTLNIDLSINDVSNIKTIYVSENGSEWKSFDGKLRNLKYDISGNVGEKSVYIKAEDVCGNVSKTVSKKIKYDNELPTGSIFINDGANNTTTNKVNIKANFADSFSGIKSVAIKEGTKVINLSKEQINKGSISIPWTLNYGTSPHLELEVVDNAGNLLVVKSNPIKVVVNNLEISSFKLNNASHMDYGNKSDSLTWSFPSQEMRAGSKLNFKIEYIKPNVGDNISVNGNYNITILNDNGYSKVETVNFSKENSLDNAFVGEFTLPKDVPVGSKVYFSSTIKADIKKDGKTTTQEVVFPLKNCQAEIGHVIGKK